MWFIWMNCGMSSDLTVQKGSCVYWKLLLVKHRICQEPDAWQVVSQWLMLLRLDSMSLPLPCMFVLSLGSCDSIFRVKLWIDGCCCKCFDSLQDSGSAMRGLEASLLAPSFDLVLNAGQPIDAQAPKSTLAWVGVTFANLQLYTACI